MAVLKNKEERLSFMKSFLQELIKSNLLDKKCKNTSMANGDSGCYLSHHHGRLPKLMSIGVYSNSEGDCAFLRFWENESDVNTKEIINKREIFLKQNESLINEYLGKEIFYKSNNYRQIGNFNIKEKDNYWQGFCAYYKVRKSKAQLHKDLCNMSKVLKLFMDAKNNQALSSGNIKTAKQLEDEFEKEVAKINFKRTCPPDFRHYGKIKKTSPRYLRSINFFDRDPQVVADALWLAKGVCQGCGADKNSLFRKSSDGEVYLEVHHIQPLSEGGSDTLDNACALCPTCHRMMHYGMVSDIKRIHKNIRQKLEEREKLIKKILDEQQCTL